MRSIIAVSTISSWYDTLVRPLKVTILEVGSLGCIATPPLPCLHQRHLPPQQLLPSPPSPPPLPTDPSIVVLGSRLVHRSQRAFGPLKQFLATPSLPSPPPLPMLLPPLSAACSRVAFTSLLPPSTPPAHNNVTATSPASRYALLPLLAAAFDCSHLSPTTHAATPPATPTISAAPVVSVLLP
ncbi:hypothetical protein BHM03_00059371 [Ensete ventricosum]|nr:hypothetical protein BHM03_00059371 [Ensete ventricosum]